MSTRRDEAGAVLVFTTICLVVMLGFAAVVIDLGIAYGHRRSMQGAADAAALGAAQNLAKGDITGATTTATVLGDQNLRGQTISWNACAGDTLPSGYQADASQNCVSFNRTWDRVRVRVPKQSFPTLFGGILGINSLKTSTVAIAGLVGVGNGGGLLPFALTGSFGSGDYCLDSGGAGNSVAPCNGPTTGNFGVLDFAGCVSNQNLGDNIAAGADHLYGSNPTGTLADIPDDCTQPRPNTVSTKPGNNVGPETSGMITGTNFSDGGPARLQRVPTNCGSFSPAWETVSAACGTAGAIDNRPLWEFIPETPIAGIPASCQRATFDALLATLAAAPVATQRLGMHAALLTCVNDYVLSGSTAPVFTAMTGGVVDHGLPLFDLQESPRFSYVPQMLETVPCNGRCTYRIKAFRAVFVQRTGKNNSPSFFEPGPWNGNQLPDSSSADTTGIVFPAPRANCTPTPTDSCGTMLPGLLGGVGGNQVVIGGNATVQLIG
jgi:Flp pilus assembly protein TadG